MADSGFEYAGLFYPWHVTTTGKDLLLIDRIAAIPPQEFFQLVEDEYDMSRAPVTLALIATSMRNRHPERSLERIIRAVMDMSLDDIEFVGDEDSSDDQADPTPAGAESGPSSSPSDTSNGSQAATSKTSSATPG